MEDVQKCTLGGPNTGTGIASNSGLDAGSTVFCPDQKTVLAKLGAWQIRNYRSINIKSLKNLCRIQETIRGVELLTPQWKSMVDIKPN